MKKILLVLFFAFIASNLSYSQNNIFSFFEYDIKDGMRDQFINGYAKDLEWHKSQGDDWSWVGWFVVNGKRRDRFIDATPDHNWSDFDNWKINAKENSRLNKINWVPYVENSSGSYKMILEEASRYDKNWYKSKFLQVYYIEIVPGIEEAFEIRLEKTKSFLKKKLKNNSFVWMKTISGGNVNEYCLYVALNKIEELSFCDNLFEDSPFLQNNLEGLYRESVKKILSELWSYSESLSLFSDKE
jgi:hypothetical protein